MTEAKNNYTSLTMLPETKEVKRPFDILQELASCQGDPLQDIEKPSVCVEILNEKGNIAPACTLGNFSLFMGKAKTKKTFLVTVFMASVVSGRCLLGRIRGAKGNVAFFDTEQGRYHFNRTIKRVCQLAKEENPENFKSYALRKYTPSERLQLIEYVLDNTPDLTLVVIDGLRDLLTKGINDEENATQVISKILRWTEELNIHILLVLHQNKADNNARGHVGTECVNKAETVISITLDESKEISIVEDEFCRDMPFEKFSFSIDDSGLPVECDLPQSEKKQVKQSNPEQITDDTHILILNTFYRNNPKPTYSELRDGIIYGFHNSFGQSKCRQFITHYFQKKWIEKDREGQKVIYAYKRAIF